MSESAEHLLSQYAEWVEERADLEGTLDVVRSNEAGLDLMHALARELLRQQKVRPDLLTVEEIASQMRVSKMTVYRLCHGGDLPSIQFGRSFRVAQADLDEYVRRNGTG